MEDSLRGFMESNLHGVQVVNKFSLVAKILSKSNGIFLSQISKNFEELVKRKLVEGRVGLRVLFGIKLDNILEANAIDDIKGKRKGRV